MRHRVPLSPTGPRRGLLSATPSLLIFPREAVTWPSAMIAVASYSTALGITLRLEQGGYCQRCHVPSVFLHVFIGVDHYPRHLAMRDEVETSVGVFFNV